MTKERDDNDPEVILAKAQADALEVEANSKLHWTSQLAHTIIGNLNSCGSNAGCLFIILIIVVLMFNQELVAWAHLLLNR